LEAIGAALGLILALLILQSWEAHCNSRAMTIACALISMAVLDVFHSCVPVGVSFVWLHSLAVLAGGAFFVLVWFPQRETSKKTALATSGTVLLLAVLAGFLSALYPTHLPVMVTEGRFSPAANTINALGGGLAIFGAVGFAVHYYAKRNLQELLFLLLALLFGVSGVIFMQSSVWDASWWFLHVLRFTGYVLAFFLALLSYRTPESQVRSSHVASAYVRSLIEASLDPLVTIGPDGRITDVNRATEEATGVSRQKLVGTDFADYFTEPDQARAGYQRVFTDGVVRDYPLELRHRSGRLMSVAYNASVYRDEAGAVAGVFAAARDLSEIKRAEIEPLEARYGTILSTAMDGFWIVDMEGRFLESNDAYCAMSGYSREELLTMRIPDVECVEGAEDAARHVAMVAREGRDRFETRHRRKDGTVYDVEISVQAMPVNGGVLVVFLRDISARKVAEEALRESESRLDYALETINAGAWDLDLLDQTAHRTMIHDRIFGYETLLPNWTFEVFLDHVLPEDRPDVARKFREAVAAQAEWRFECRIRRADGEVRWIWVAGTHRRSPEGKATRMSGVVLDVTDRKRAEDLLVQKAADLERSNKELEQFAYVASHDLQEPLRMVSSFTQLLGERYAGQLDEKAKKYIDYAVDGAVRMQRLINDLLFYSRVGTRGQPLESADSHAILGEAIANLAATIEETGAMVTQDDLPTVRADASQLVQVFQNLIANAMKFTGDAPPRIHVSARDDGRHWTYAVRDNGIGIDPQHVERVFVIFQRLHTRQEYPGTGIGLALCKRIVERHDGRIWFESEPGAGSTFFFTIPK
jgi:PAS domain S-box-containing protein